MKLKKIKDYFGFSHNEVRGIIFLLVIIFFAFVVPMLVQIYLRGERKEMRPVAAERILVPVVDSEKTKAFVPAIKDTGCFPFDPNTVSIDDLLRLGFPKKQAHTLIHFREKGKIFREKEDLKKVNGLTDEMYRKIEACIDIDSGYRNTRKLVKKENATPVIFELNTVDSSQLESIRGIGPKLASRIVKYRNKLGGFVGPEQLKEVHGLSDSLFDKVRNRFTADKNLIRKVFVNKQTSRELHKHPYISKYQAEGLLLYVQKQGKIRNDEDLRRIKLFPDSVLCKILPYIDYN